MICDLCDQEQPKEKSACFGPYTFCEACIAKEIARSGEEMEAAIGRPPFWPLSEEAAARVLAGRWFGFSVTTEEREQQAQDDRLFAGDHSWASDNRGLSAPEQDDDLGTFGSGE